MIVVFTLIALAVGFAWVGGYLDAYQAKGQEKALDMMGENKASYGLKSILLKTSSVPTRMLIHHACQAPFKARRLEMTRTSMSCKTKSATPLVDSLAKEVLVKVSGQASARGFR